MIRSSLPVVAISIFLLIIGYFVVSRYLSTDKGEVEVERIMIAVLPFENLGPPEDEYFADGITEELTARLVGAGGLGVIARMSSMQYKNTDKHVRQIGEELGVDYILEGTIRWQRASDDPSRIRITPQLVRVSDATNIWAEIYDEPFTKVFEMQTDITIRVVEAMGVVLLGKERESLESMPTRNFEAYTYYLHSKEFARWYSKPDMLRAQQMLEKAIELDPGFALAYAELANIHGAHFWYAHDRSEARVTKAREAAEMALQLAPELPEAHMAMEKYYHMCLRDWDRAQVEFEIVLKSLPNNAKALCWIGFVQRHKGKWAESLENMANAVKLSPLQHLWIADLGITYSLLRRYSKAERFYDRAILLKPGDPQPRTWKVWDYLKQGRMVEAREVLRQALEHVDAQLLLEEILLVDLFDGRYDEMQARLSSVDSEILRQAGLILTAAEFYELIGQSKTARSYYDSSRVFLERKLREDPDDSRLHSALGIAYAGLGQREDAITEGRVAVELSPIAREAVVGPSYVENLAKIYMMVGEFDAAVDQLEYLLSIPGDLTVGWLQLDPRWNALRDHPRFQKLIEGKS